MNINELFPINKPSKLRIFFYLSVGFCFELPAAVYCLNNVSQINGINIFLFESFIFSFFYLIHFSFKGNVRPRNNRIRKYGMVFAIIFFYNIFISYELFDTFFISKKVELMDDSKLILLFSISFTQSIFMTADIIMNLIKLT